MVVEKRAPGLRWPGAPLRDEPRDRALGHVEAKLQKLAMDSWGAPEWIRGGHASDQGPDLGVDGWTISGGPAGEPGPVTRGSAAAATAGPCPGSRSREAPATRPRL
jgi:hypothetical protein